MRKKQTTTDDERERLKMYAADLMQWGDYVTKALRYSGIRNKFYLNSVLMASEHWEKFCVGMTGKKPNGEFVVRAKTNDKKPV